MSNKTEFQSWKNQFKAGLKGDSDEVTTERAWRGAKSRLEVEIATLNGLTVSLEMDVESEQDKLVNARFNGHKIITSDTPYISNLLNARNNLVKAEKALKVHNEKLDFLKEELDKLLKN